MARRERTHLLPVIVKMRIVLSSAKLKQPERVNLGGFNPLPGPLAAEMLVGAGDQRFRLSFKYS